MDRNRELPPGLEEVFDDNERSVNKAKGLIEKPKELPNSEENECDYCGGGIGGCRYCDFGRRSAKKEERVA